MLRRSLVLNLGGHFGALAIGFVGSILLARLLGPADRGLLELMFSTANIAMVVTGLGLPFAVMFYAARRDANQGALLGNSLLYGLVLACVLVPLAWLFHEEIAALLSRGRGGLAWVLAAAFVPVLFLDYTVRNQLSGALRFAAANVVTVTTTAAQVAFVIVFIGLAGLGVGGGVLALIGGSGLSALIGGTLLARRARPTVDLPLFRRSAGYGVRVQLGTLFQLLNFRLDVIILQFFRPLREVGYYVAAQIVAELVLTLARAFQSSVLPLVSHYEGRSEQGATTTASLRHHTLLAGGAVAANAMFGPLVLYLYGPAFSPAYLPFFILLPGMWFLGTAQVAASDLRGRERPGTSSLLAGLAVVVTVVLDLILIPPFGVVGAAIASLSAYTAFGIASLVVLARVSGIGLRALVVPTRAELVAYPRAARALAARIRR